MYFVDYGTYYKDAKHEELRHIPPECIEVLPKQAIKCRLLQLDDSEDTDHFHSEFRAWLWQLIDQSNAFTVHSKEYRNDINLYQTNLKHTGTGYNLMNEMHSHKNDKKLPPVNYQLEKEPEKKTDVIATLNFAHLEDNIINSDMPGMPLFNNIK